MEDDLVGSREDAGLSDVELWVALREDDPRAFPELYVRHAPVVYSATLRHLMCLGIRHDVRQLCEDATAEAFLHAWRRRSDIHVTGSLRPWLIATAWHAASNRVRADTRQRRVLARLATVGDVREDVPDVVDEVMGHQMLDLIQTLIARLPAAEAQVVTQCLLLDRSIEEVSRHLGVPAGTVKSRLHRAKARLRTALREPRGDPPALSPGA